MFNNFFIRTPYPEFNQNQAVFIKEKLRPEIYLNSQQLTKIGPKEINKMKGILKNFPAHTIHAPFYDISPGGLDKEIRDISLKKMNKIIHIAREWDTYLIVMHFNFNPIYYLGYYESWLNNASHFYSQLLQDKETPMVALENIAESTPEIILQLISRIQSQQVIHCFDFGHHHVFGSISFDQWLSQFREKKHIHFHFHDNIGLQDDHLPLGQGNIKWEQAKKTILSLNTPFSVTLEPHSTDGMRQTTGKYRQLFLT